MVPRQRRFAPARTTGPRLAVDAEHWGCRLPVSSVAGESAPSGYDFPLVVGD
jgi:hypothetical protein